MSQLAVAWCLKNESVNCLLLGATSVEQFKEHIHALQVPTLKSKYSIILFTMVKKYLKIMEDTDNKLLMTKVLILIIEPLLTAYNNNLYIWRIVLFFKNQRKSQALGDKSLPMFSWIHIESKCMIFKMIFLCSNSKIGCKILRLRHTHAYFVLWEKIMI